MTAEQIKSLISSTFSFHDGRLANGVLPTDRARILTDIIAA